MILDNGEAMLDKNQIGNKFNTMVGKHNSDVQQKKADTMALSTLLALADTSMDEPMDDGDEESEDDKSGGSSGSDSDSSCPAGLIPILPIAHSLPPLAPPIQKHCIPPAHVSTLTHSPFSPPPGSLRPRRHRQTSPHPGGCGRDCKAPPLGGFTHCAM